MRIAVGVLYSLLPEILLLIVASLLVARADAFSPAGLLTARILALVIMAVALGLCLQFNRSRMGFALLSLLLAGLALDTLADAGSSTAQALFSGTLCLLLPLNLIYCYRGEDRGVFTRHGARHFGLLLLQMAVIAALLLLQPRALATALHVRFLDWSALSHTPITQPGLLALGLGLLFFNDQLILRHSAELAAFFFALLCAAVMLHTRNPLVLAVFTAATGLAFGFAVIQESWNMAYLDTLTGLPGRRALDEELRKLGRDYVIAMLDVDHFKRFNDTHGHDVGDQLLRLVASRLQKQMEGKAFRYGGEEFSLIFAGQGLRKVMPKLEALRADIETSGFDLRRYQRRRQQDAANLLPADSGTAASSASAANSAGKPRGGERRQQPDSPSPPASAADAETLHVTVSIGAAVGGSTTTPTAVLRTADRALYDAKHAGRNRVCVRED